MKSIAVDFDGVIHKYSKGWHDGTIYDGSVDGAFEAIKTLMQTHTVFVLSARSSRQIKKWLDQQLWFWDAFSPDDKCLLHGYNCEIIPFYKRFWDKPNVLGITNRKLPAEYYIDDRGITFENWEKVLSCLQ